MNKQEIIDKQMVFLVVDDFEPMRKVTSGQLRSMGASIIVTANDGAQALRMLKLQRVDLVLSDWNMPVMTGLELLKEMRADKKLSRLPFIMITAEAERDRIDEAITCGVSDMLVKPYTTERFARRVVKALNSWPLSSAPIHAPLTASNAALAASPVAAMPAVSVAPVIQGADELARPTILVVDDTPECLLVIANLFKDEYRVRIAHSGSKALDICQSNDPPDLVLLDVMMPGIDGFEVARRMREHPTSETIPLIFITALTGEDARLKGLELGAVDFVTKPIDPAVLRTQVRNFMRYVAQRKQLQVDIDGMLELARLREDVERITRHDMKGPLAGVIGLVQALADDNTMSHKHVEQLRMVEATALQVLNMINLSSELFKIETGHFKLDARPVMIGDILRRIVGISRTTFAEKHLVIAVDTDVSLGKEVPLALGDAMLCYSLFHNLVKNACEAAPDGSRVSVTLKNETPLRILIENQGVVPAEIRQHFFGKFVTHGKQEGTGLGTYSAKLLAEAQHGEISLKVSDQENQTLITVTLPHYVCEWL